MSIVKKLKVIRENKAYMALISLGFCLIFICTATFALTKTRLETMKSVINYGVDFKDESSIELGSQATAVPGKDGVRNTTVRYSQSYFDYFFKIHKAKQQVISTRLASKATNQVVLKGTKKWQYMLCSNGAYRFYTNEQFQNPLTGFVSSSPDNCSQNNQGHKIKLADSPSGVSTASRPTYTPPNCSIVDIPYKTVYQDVTWLYVGQTQDGYGANGFKYVCADGTTTSSFQPFDKVIYRGTGSKPVTNFSTLPTAPLQPSPNYAAKQKCDSEYSYAKAQIDNAGAGNSSATQQLQYAYAQCLNSAGY